VRKSSLFNQNFSPNQIFSQEELGDPVFRRRRDYSQGVCVGKSGITKPNSSRATATAKNRSLNNRQSAKP